MVSCVVADTWEGTLEFFAYDIDLASGKAHLWRIDPSKTSFGVPIGKEEVAAISNLERLMSEEDWS